jgi:hypothetical protein
LDQFFPEALDVNVRFEFDGRPPAYPPTDHRIGPDASLANIPVFDFLEGVVSALTSWRGWAGLERVLLTSTDYFLELRRRDALVELRLIQANPSGVEVVVSRSTMDWREFVNEFAGACQVFLLDLSDVNRDLGSSPKVRDLQKAFGRILSGADNTHQ